MKDALNRLDENIQNLKRNGGTGDFRPANPEQRAAHEIVTDAGLVAGATRIPGEVAHQAFERGYAAGAAGDRPDHPMSGSSGRGREWTGSGSGSSESGTTSSR